MIEVYTWNLSNLLANVTVISLIKMYINKHECWNFSENYLLIGSIRLNSLNIKKIWHCDPS